MRSTDYNQPDFAAWVASALAQLAQVLSAFLPHESPAGLGEAMRYAVLGEGKRLRPLLVLASFDYTCDNTPEAGCMDLALRAACSVELMHAYSLVHDDMPCMDNDTLRRGKPTVHVAYGEAQALLAGDALQALAFELLAAPQTEPTIQVQLCCLLAQACGMRGMAGGQAIDLASVGKTMSLDGLQNMHALKTGTLLHTSVIMGAVCAQRHPIPDWLNAYGKTLGLLFQVVDDILDATQSDATLGKTAGKDALNSKPTYVAVLGLKDARQYADTLYRRAQAILQEHNKTEKLYGLLNMAANRCY